MYSELLTFIPCIHTNDIITVYCLPGILTFLQYSMSPEILTFLQYSMSPEILTFLQYSMSPEILTFLQYSMSPEILTFLQYSMSPEMLTFLPSILTTHILTLKYVFPVFLQPSISHCNNLTLLYNKSSSTPSCNHNLISTHTVLHPVTTIACLLTQYSILKPQFPFYSHSTPSCNHNFISTHTTLHPVTTILFLFTQYSIL